MRAIRLTLGTASLSLAPLTNFDIGALSAALIALGAYRARTLTADGAFAAFIIGTCTFGGGGLRAALILLAFFIPSVALSRLGRARKRRLIDIAKSGARDGAQVFANGAIAAGCALALFVSGSGRWETALAGAFAAATADTWGTEVGTLARQMPRSILTLRPVATGLSGGVTAVGTLAELVGAAFIAAVALALGLRPWPAVAAGGVAGALVDSILGATLQQLRWCAQCQRACETDPHACGAGTTLIRGAAWITNDAVNFGATLTGALVAFALGG